MSVALMLEYSSQYNFVINCERNGTVLFLPFHNGTWGLKDHILFWLIFLYSVLLCGPTNSNIKRWNQSFRVIFDYYDMKLLSIPLIFNTNQSVFYNTTSANCVVSHYPNVTWCQNMGTPKTHAHQPSHQIRIWAW